MYCYCIVTVCKCIHSPLVILLLWDMKLFFSTVSVSPVPLSDLAYLSGLPVAAVWRRLGLQLGVPSYQLDIMQENHAGRIDPSSHCLNSVFVWWLNNSDSRTPNQLATALSVIGKRDVAESVAQKYGMYCNPYNRLIFVSVLIGLLQYVLHCDCLISLFLYRSHISC